MELKEFIKCAIKDITEAISESQKELNNGCIISPGDINGSSETLTTSKGEMAITPIQFEISVETCSGEHTGGGISVATAIFSANGKKQAQQSNQNVSTLKFTVPVVFPPDLNYDQKIVDHHISERPHNMATI